MNIDTRWADGAGYRPVRVTFSTWPPAPAAADRRLRVVLYPNCSDPRFDAYQSVTAVIDLPQGATSLTKVVPVPQDEEWRALFVEVWEDGRLLEDLSGSTVVPFATGEWSEALPTILFVDRDAPGLSGPAPSGQTYGLPEVKGLATLIPENEQFSVAVVPGFGATGVAREEQVDVADEAVERRDDAAILADLKSLPTLLMLPPHDLPEDWLHYTCLDVIIISLDDLRLLAAQYPERWQAIRRWTATGSSLWVYGVGREWEQQAELDKLLDSAPTNTPPYQWREPSAGQRASLLIGLTDAYRDYYGQPEIESDEAVMPPPEGEAPPFRWRRLELGNVVAIGADEFPRNPVELAWIFNSLGADRWQWYRRHGISLRRENDDFWSFLVPGVGKSPVFGFLVVISLFVILVGPTNYWMLWRARRLYLLLVTVPLGAALFTIGLIVYALVADGLGMRARVRSFTYVDQLSDHTVSWSRQSYYAGMNPSGGLRFPDEAAVYTIESRPQPVYNRQGPVRRLAWYADQQVLEGGYLRARTMKQFLVLQSAPTARELVVDAASAADSRLRVHNRLDATIEQLFVCDDQGTIYQGRHIAAGQRQELPPANLADAQAELGRLLASNRPRMPEGFDPSDHQNSILFGRPTYWYNSVDQHLSAPRVNGSVMEQELSRLTARGDGWLQRRHYVAVVPASPFVGLAHPSAREEGSFHVVIGRW